MLLLYPNFMKYASKTEIRLTCIRLKENLYFFLSIWNTLEQKGLERIKNDFE